MNKIFCFLFFPLFASAQPRLTTPVPFAGYDFLNKSSIYSHSDTVEIGSYLFPKLAGPASIKLRNGRIYTGIKAAINLMTNELVFQDSAGQLYTAIVDIDSVEFKQSEICPANTVFKTGFPKIDNFNERTFFEVLSEGKVALLKAYKISYIDKTVLGTTAPVRQYDTKEILYTYSKEKGITKLSKSKDDVLTIMNDKNAEISGYLKQHKINFKSQADLAQLFNYYNSL